MKIEFLGGPRDGETVDLADPREDGTWLPPRTMHFASPRRPPVTSTWTPEATGPEPIPLHTYILSRTAARNYYYCYHGMETI